MGDSLKDFNIEFKCIFVSEGELLADFWKRVEVPTVPVHNTWNLDRRMKTWKEVKH
jgi:hypothetical protein